MSKQFKLLLFDLLYIPVVVVANIALRTQNFLSDVYMKSFQHPFIKLFFNASSLRCVSVVMVKNSHSSVNIDHNIKHLSNRFLNCIESFFPSKKAKCFYIGMHVLPFQFLSEFFFFCGVCVKRRY